MRKQKKFTQKLFLVYSVFFLTVLFIIFISALMIIYQEQYKRVLDTQLQLVTKTENQIDESLQSMDRIVNGLLFDKNFMEIIKDENAVQHYTDYSKQVLNSFVSLDAPLFPTHRIIAFNDSIYYNFSKTGENQEYIKQIIGDYPWKEEILSQNGEKTFLSTHQDPFESSPMQVYSVARAITDGKGTYGIVEVQNSYEYLSTLCSLDAQVGQVALFSDKGELVYPQKKDEFLSKLFSSLKTDNREGKGCCHYSGQQICYSVSAYSGWITVIYKPIDQIIPFAFPLGAVVILSFLVLAAGTLMIVKIITNRLTSPLVALNQALKQVSIDNLSLELPTQYGIEEIESINQSFLTMFTQLKESIACSVQARANEERANYLALQSQMNPHTIYNTIGMIESVSYINGDKEVSNLCICFSEMLRYISDYTRRDYTIRDELLHVNNYAVLIETRYSGKLEIYTDVDETLQTKVIPKFTIQPLVENSVKHGFGGSCNHLVVWVRILRQTEGWMIQVRDNGKGFSKERIEEIQEQFFQCEESLKARDNIINRKIGNLALSNIYIRWRILYGKNFSFSVKNNEDEPGACLELFVKEKEEKEET